MIHSTSPIWVSQTSRAKPAEETRVAWLAPSLARGWRWQSLFKEFSRINPNTIFFTGFWPGFGRGFEGTFRIQQVPGFRYWGSERGGVESGNRFMWASPRILARLVRFRPQVILTNGFHVWTFYALLVKAFFHSRLVLLWQGVSPETGGEPGTLRLKLRRALARFFDLAVTNTEEGVRYLEDSVGIPPQRVKHFVGEVADRSAFPSARQPSLESLARPLFLFVGRLVRGKGVEQFLTACSLLVHQGTRNFSVVVVGDGPGMDDFRTLAVELGLQGHLRWEGFVLYEELGAYYEASDVFVLPSLEDTWGVAALEAMAFAKPVLVSRYAGANEVVEHGVNGYVFDPYKPHDLSACMTQFIQHPDKSVQFGRASERIMARHTPRLAAERLAEMICQSPLADGARPERGEWQAPEKQEIFATQKHIEH